ncbi:TPR-like protein [Aspergillus pseudonomiae]|nr:TPR-like protein [Aspergillus pseudonomiae]
MSGLDVIGSISAIISLLDTSIKIYDSARNDIKLSSTFEAVRRRLPVLLHTLETCKNHLELRKDTIPEDVCHALEKSLDACDAKASNLRGIFEKVIPGESDTREKRYLKILRRLGKGNKVEELIRSITEDVHLITNHDMVQSANPQQNLELDDILKEMNSVDSSAPDEENLGMTFMNGGGTQYNYVHRGHGPYHVNSGSGKQYIAEHQSFVVKPETDFSFRRGIGICLGRAPRIAPELFVGRGYELDEIRKILHPSHKVHKQQRRLVLGGMGGIGKSQLAIAYGESTHGSYSSVFWLNAASETVLRDSFRTIASSIFDVELEDKESVRRVHKWLCDPQNTGWLLIFDNYDEPTQFRIEHYYPLASHGTIVVTTRRPDLVGGTPLHIKPFQNIEDSIAILQTRSKREDIRSDHHTRRLAERLAGLPLALATAGTYLHRSTFTFERYLEEYEKRWNIDPHRTPQLQEYQERTLYTTWDLSYSRLEKEDPDAAKILKLLAYFDNQKLWYGLFYAGLTDSSPKWLSEATRDDVNFNGVMRNLADYYFLDVHQTADSWSIHNCVHDWTLATLNKDIDETLYWYAFDCIAASISHGNKDDFAKLSYCSLAAHATRLVEQRFCQNDTIYTIPADRVLRASRIADLLTKQALFLAAEQMSQRALAGFEKALGPDHTSTLIAGTNLGVIYQNQGKLDQGEKLFQRALARFEKLLRPDHPLTLGTVNNLGLLYRHKGKLDQAEQLYQRVLAGFEKALGPVHMITLITVNNLGLLYQSRGKLDQGEQLFQRAIACSEKAFGPDDPLTLSTISNLGNLYRDQGRLDQAEQLYQRVIACSEKALGPDHMLTLNTVYNSGILYQNRGKLDRADELYQRALAGFEKPLGLDHPLTLGTISNLGNLYRDQGKLDQAEQMDQRAGRVKVKREDAPCFFQG